MKRLILLVVVAVLGVGCASSRLEQRVATLERELAAAKQTETAIVDESDESAPAPFVTETVGLVMTVDEKPNWCSGPLCWRIETGHNQPVLVSINGHPTVTDGPYGPFLPPRSTGWIRLTTPTTVVVTYEAHDTIEGIPTAPPLFSCRAGPFRVGTFADAYWGGKTTHLDASFCL